MFWIYHSLARSKLIFIWVPAMTFSDDIISTTWSSDPSLLGYFSIMVGAPMPPLTPPYLPARCWPLTTVVVSITGFTGGDDGLFPNRKSSGRKRPFSASLRDRDIWYFSFCCYFKNKINKKWKSIKYLLPTKLDFSAIWYVMYQRAEKLIHQIYVDIQEENLFCLHTTKVSLRVFC